MFELFSKGGIIMYPLLLSSIVALAVIIERLWFLRRKKILVPEIINVLDKINSTAELNIVSSICEKMPGPFARIIRLCLDNQDLPPDELRALVEDEGRQEVRILERGLVTLETVAAVAPLMGLLGTVIGMIKVFNIIQTLGVGQAKALSGGISEALITTATGLVVGILALIAYNYFRHRSEAFILDIEKYSNRLIQKIDSIKNSSNTQQADK